MPKKGPSTISERLSRASGQLKAVEHMVKEEQDVQKVVIQLQAVISSLESAKLEIIKQQIRSEILKALDSSVGLIK
ncbi:MAG: metal-sensitive transcriptional regulator [Candidatus Dojkabacteria bacterium]|nr:MAG: metal-sensitive transcriptional regulator [Candidatus Dojkabacteria bacterium]